MSKPHAISDIDFFRDKDFCYDQFSIDVVAFAFSFLLFRYSLYNLNNQNTCLFR